MQTRFFRCIDCETVMPVKADFWIECITGDIITSVGQTIHYDGPTIKERYCTNCQQIQLEKLIKELKPVEESYKRP